MKILLILPPMTQVNTPYPSLPYLSHFLRNEGHEVTQLDLGLELFLEIFSVKGLNTLRHSLDLKSIKSEFEVFFLENFKTYQSTIEPVITLLQGKNLTLAHRIARRQMLPEGPRFLPLDEYSFLENNFGQLGIQDKAKYIATLYIDDLNDLIRDNLDSRFQLSRYGESLASSQSSFQSLLDNLSIKTPITNFIENLFLENLQKFSPDLILFSLPFPGNVFASLLCANSLKSKNIKVPIAVGGGYVNTELRELSDPRFFQFFDYLMFDDGELPLRKLIAYLNHQCDDTELIRTSFIKNDCIVPLKQSTTPNDIPFKKNFGPSYQGLDLSRYISMMEVPNPMHRMWSDLHWNKLILAHGCYWKKCTFCDVTLDYIGRYEPMEVQSIISIMKRLIDETGQTGFHFVDEAAPPQLIQKLCEAIIKENLPITWWGNFRFDERFKHLADLMADAGCVAVTGGLEVGSPRVLSMIDKGITIEQVANVTKALSQAGIFVHAYLMYGFPTQTIQETIDSLEVVRQLFTNECIHSGYWHRFMCTAHSPVGKNPQKFHITLRPDPIPSHGLFAKNTVDFIENDHLKNPEAKNRELDFLGRGLNKALYNYIHGVGLDDDVRVWFDETVPKAKIKPTVIRHYLKNS